MPKEADVNPASDASLEAYDPTPVVRAEHAEDAFTRVIEHQAAKVPSEVFLFAALSSMVASAGLQLAGRESASRFIGMWAPALLIMGVYNKLVKLLRPQ
jgi:hypothetical protein